MSTRNNPIKQQLTNYYDELITAKRFIKRLMRVLSDDSCLVIAEIRIIIQEMPNFIFLKHQSDFLKGTLRKICSYELTVPEASDIVQQVYVQVLEAIAVFDSDNL